VGGAVIARHIDIVKLPLVTDMICSQTGTSVSIPRSVLISPAAC
jgi:hypothetical protein